MITSTAEFIQMRILFAPICFRMAICCISECGLAISSRYFESIGRCVKMRTFKKRSVRMSRNLRLSSPLPSNSWAPGTISEKLAGKECCQPMYFCSNCSSDEAISNRFSEASQPRLFPYKTYPRGCARLHYNRAVLLVAIRMR